MLPIREHRAAFERSIRFTELTAAALDLSTLELIGEGPIPDHQDLYEGWRRSFDTGRARAYTEPVASIVRIFLRHCDTVNARVDVKAPTTELVELTPPEVHSAPAGGAP